MADPKRKLTGNQDGQFFVDSTCRNMDICRQLAPQNFIEWQGYAVVGKQPGDDNEARQMLHAVLCCPYGSVGTVSRSRLAEVIEEFPLPIDDGVYFCGFNSPKTAGGHSYLIQNPSGNWLVNVPRFQSQLVKRLEQMGGVRYIFMSHRDDVGEADKFSGHFGSTGIIHENDLDAKKNAELVLQGDREREILPGFLAIPTAGHTEGHTMLLYGNRYLFSGDSLYFDRKCQRVEIWSPYWTWFSYIEQVASLKRLLRHQFEWLLPSHGQRVLFSRETMHSQLVSAIERAEAEKNPEPEDEIRLKNLEYYYEELQSLGQNEYAGKIRDKARKLETKLSAKEERT